MTTKDDNAPVSVAESTYALDTSDVLPEEAFICHPDLRC